MKKNNPISNETVVKSVNAMRRILESIRESGGRYITLGA